MSRSSVIMKLVHTLFWVVRIIQYLYVPEDMSQRARSLLRLVMEVWSTINRRLMRGIWIFFCCKNMIKYHLSLFFAWYHCVIIHTSNMHLLQNCSMKDIVEWNNIKVSFVVFPSPPPPPPILYALPMVEEAPKAHLISVPQLAGYKWWICCGVVVWWWSCVCGGGGILGKRGWSRTCGFCVRLGRGRWWLVG